MSERQSVLFVCLGNICRSPTAEAVFKKRAAAAGLNVYVESAGTGGWHVGEPPDPRAIRAGESRGYSFAGQTAQALTHKHFENFDLLLAMDNRNLSHMQGMVSEGFQDKIRLFLSFNPGADVTEVPDPYYGGESGFDRVLDLIEGASDGLIDYLQRS